MLDRGNCQVNTIIVHTEPNVISFIRSIFK